MEAIWKGVISAKANFDSKIKQYVGAIKLKMYVS